MVEPRSLFHPEPLDPAVARLAAEWWMDCLRGTPIHDAGNRDGADDISVMLQLASGGLRPLTEAQIQIFGTRLMEHLVTEEDLGVLRVDYHPCPYLADALIAACIDGPLDHAARLPIKTTMWIENDDVRVSMGYCAPDTILFTCKRRALIDAVDAAVTKLAFELYPRPVQYEQRGTVYDEIPMRQLRALTHEQVARAPRIEVMVAEVMAYAFAGDPAPGWLPSSPQASANP